MGGDFQHIQDTQAKDTIDVELQMLVNSTPNKHEEWNEEEDHVKLVIGRVSIAILKKSREIRTLMVVPERAIPT